MKSRGQKILFSFLIDLTRSAVDLRRFGHLLVSEAFRGSVGEETNTADFFESGRGLRHLTHMGQALSFVSCRPSVRHSTSLFLIHRHQPAVSRPLLFVVIPSNQRERSCGVV